MKESYIRRLLWDICNTWDTHPSPFDADDVFRSKPHDSFSGLLHADCAIKNGSVFVFPRSLYKDYRNKVSSEEYFSVKEFPKLDLPYDACLFVEYEDDAESPLFGKPTAVTVAYYDDHPQGLTYTKSGNVMTNDEIVDYGRIMFSADPGFYSVTSATLVVAWLNSSHSERVEHVVADKVIKKRLRKGRKTDVYHGKFTELREKNPTFSVSVDRKTGLVQAHLVRGHFKRRKTGVFWWKPHIAGSGELKKRDAYIVKP